MLDVPDRRRRPEPPGSGGIRGGTVRAVSVAHVGHTGTDDDRDRWLAACLWLQRNDEALHERIGRARSEGRLKHDAIDLNAGPPRDFLRERGRYDVVITHNLWFPPGGSRPAEGPGGAAVSPLGRRGAWRHRLRGTRARHIFMFGTAFNAVHLGETLPGYAGFAVPAAPPLTVFAAGTADVPPDRAAQPITYRDMTAARTGALADLSANAALDLSYAAVGRDEVLRLAAMASLKELRLVGTAVTDRDCADLAGCGSLEYLGLDETAVTGAALAHVGRLARLDRLSLNGTRVDDAGLGFLRNAPSLSYLSLVDTPVGDRGLARLAACGALRRLAVAGTRISPAGLGAFRRARPDCAVVSGFD